MVRISNEKGSVVILALGVSSVLMAMAASLFLMSRGATQGNINHILMSGTVRLIKGNLMTIISSQSGGQNTAVYLCNSSAGASVYCCMANSTTCTSGMSQNNVAISYDGLNAYYNANLATAGFDITGAPCVAANTFPPTPDKAATLTGCIFHPNLTLSLTCPAGCVNPPWILNLTFPLPADPSTVVAPGSSVNWEQFTGPTNGGVSFE